MKFNFLGVAIILFSFLLITDAAAQSYGRGKGAARGDGWRMANLNLTQDQQDRIEKLRTDHFNEAGRLRDELDRLRIDKRSMMRETDLNKTNYLNLEKRMSGIREKISLSRAEFRMNIYELLDADQKEKFTRGGFGYQMKGRAGANFRDNVRRGFCW
jgi:Spy/CpxP family protein refolding chaperone